MLAHPARLGLLALVATAILASQFGVITAGPGEAIFDRGVLDLTIDEPTSLTFGPDGRLYIASQSEILAVTLDGATNDVLAIETIATDLAGVLGIAFDHTAAPDAPPSLYASRQELTGVPGYWGRVTTFTAPDWVQEDVIQDLPSSAPLLNHMTNGLAFDDAGRLFIAQGSNTDAGLVGNPADFYPESPGQPLDHNVDLISGDVAVFSPGHRNPYDLVFHSNGHLYSTDNGALGLDGAADCDGGTLGTSVSDELNLVEEGNYYGYPNLNRGRFDPRQCTYHAPQEDSTDVYTSPIAILPQHCSCDGIAEYHGPVLGGDMNGDLIIAQFIRGDVVRVQLSEDGRFVVEISVVAGNFDMPLDVTVGPHGTIYVAEFDDNIVSYLAPIAPAITPTPIVGDTPTPTPTSLGPTGDADCSGDTDSIDAAIVLQLTAGLIASVGCPELADVDGDGDIDAIDAAIILQIVAGLL
jgi:glucose/arabinose dehydrogenase